jgi:hypothetical protein
MLSFDHSLYYNLIQPNKKYDAGLMTTLPRKLGIALITFSGLISVTQFQMKQLYLRRQIAQYYSLQRAQ